jgi:transcriptional regulator GlxA family with amidase domain
VNSGAFRAVSIVGVMAVGDRHRPHRVVVLVRHGLMPLELGIVHQIFGAAESAEGNPLYEVITCTLWPGKIRTHADFEIDVAHGPELLGEADTVIIPATHEPDETETEGRLSGALNDALARIRPGTRIASICTGAFVLAAAGLLDGRTATTHWMSAADFRRLYPAVHLDPDVLYTDDDEVLTSAGEAAGVDLCLHLVRKDHGSVTANNVARRTIVPPHRDGGQAQFIQRPLTEPDSTSTGRVRGWMLEHLGRPVSLRDLAAQESMSVRTFTRRFREEVGMPPTRWLTLQRVDRARQLLETTDLSIERIAGDVGFGTAAVLRQHMQNTLGVSPRAYRRTFRVPRARQAF